MASHTWLHGVYNLGLPNANLTKIELAHTVCDVIGVSREVVTIGSGTDPDKRNYLVSNDKIAKAGFEWKYSLEDGIKEVEQLCALFPAQDLEKMRNI